MKTKKLTITIIFMSLLFGLPLFGQDTLFPKIEGWNVNVDAKVYDSNNLWDIIDGAADLFLEYEFVSLHTAQYVNTANGEVKVEIYQHSNSVNSFGMYSQERDPVYNFIDVGVQGYLQKGVLNFLDGPYYIKLSTYIKGTEGQDALLLIAKSISAHLKQPNSFPKVISLFPPQNRLKNREQFIARNFLGYSFFNSVFLAIYDSAASYKAFILEAGSNKQADSILTEYFKIAAGKNIPLKTEGRYIVNDSNNGLVEIAIEKQYIYGLVNCADKEFGNGYIKKLHKALAGPVN